MLRAIQNSRMEWITALIAFSVSLVPPAAAEDLEGRKHFSERLFESTFAIQGNSGGYGTAFLIRCSTTGQVYLITARHVLDSMVGDTAIVLLRKKLSTGKYTIVGHRIVIRAFSNIQYTTHPDPLIDVAALQLTKPRDSLVLDQLRSVGREMLATDFDVKKFWIHPGDNLFYLGFPLGVPSKEGGFPVLRQGHLASYPITPLLANSNLYIDGPVFEGNSGGPVYFEYEASSWNNRAVNQKGKILGLITSYKAPEAKRKIDSLKRRHDIELGSFVNSGFILELLDSLACR